MKQEWRVVELEIVEDSTADGGFKVVDQNDIGELLLEDQEYLQDNLVKYRLIEQGYIEKDHKVTVDGDENFLYINDVAPLLVLVRSEQ